MNERISQARPEGRPAPAPGPTGVPPLDPLTERFARVWRALDTSPLRPVWPFALGALYAGLALVLARSVVIAAAVTVVLVAVTGWFGRAVCARLEELDRLSD